MTPEIAEIAVGSFKCKEPPDIRGTGFVVDCLEAALWAFHRGSSFEKGTLWAVNLRDDADTAGVAHGQIAGAFYGASAIPDRWLAVLCMRDVIESFTDRLHGI